MFLLTNSSVWSLCVFIPTLYSILVLSFLLYSLPILSITSNFSTTSTNNTQFSFINGSYIANVLALPLLLVTLNSLFWVSGELSAWFGHILFSSFQSKIQVVIFTSFILYVYVFCSLTYFSSKDIYDYLITNLNMYY